MKKKVLFATLAIFCRKLPAFAQGRVEQSDIDIQVSGWIYIVSGAVIGILLLVLPIMLWRWLSKTQQWISFRTLFIFGSSFIVLLGINYLVDAFQRRQAVDPQEGLLQLLTAVTILCVVGLLLRSRSLFNRAGKADELEKLVSERTAELSAVNQRLQLEVESRKVAEREVAKREKRFRALIENIGDGIVLNDENTLVLYQSPSVTRILGYSFEERQRKPVLDYVHPQDMNAFLKLYEDLASHPGQPLPFQFRFKHKDGHFIWLEGVVTNLLHDRNVNGYVANYRDISERKFAEESLRKERYLLRTLIDNLPDYIYIKDTEFRHVINNRANVELIGATSEAETIGKTVLDYFSTDVATSFMEADRNVLASGQSVINLEERIIGHTNETRWLLTSKIPLVENNEIVGLIGISRDITDLKNAELVLRDLNATLSQHASWLAASNAELERFAYIASHDLQEPLRMVRSFLLLLKKKSHNQLDSESNQFIDFAVEGAERMKHLISDLLEYSRVGGAQEKLGPVDMNALVEYTLEMMREPILSSGAKFEIDSLPSVIGVKAQLGQVFQNLISNAIKYRGDSAPTISIVGCEEAAQWRFAVSDTGIGIDPRFHDKIFVIFQRLNSQGETKGTGLGLAICKKIIEAHGGKIWVESKPMAGSIFHFTISKQIEVAKR